MNEVKRMIEEYNNLVEKEDRLLLQNQSELLPIDLIP